ncbi:trimeric intracellular cation channel family protein [Streptomyces sp. NPDC002870]|uniref:trimeric intracellular cation channel family protein n=1 Tax=Streptomyces sp. NPDC002870 TaxID=3364666 RepID=UPI0036C99059
MNEINALMHYPLDLLGIFAFAISGAVLAVRKDYNLFATVVMAEAAGLGGGLFRDLVLGARPIAFTDPGYAAAPVVAAAIIYFSDVLQRRPQLCEVLDAAALGLFSTTGAIKALQHGFGAFAALALGVATALGGGILSSLLALEVPPVLRWDSDLYAVPAIVGAGSASFLHAIGQLQVITAVLSALVALELRLLAMNYGWRLPRSSTWRAKSQAAMQQHTPRLSATAERTIQLRLPQLSQSADKVTHRLTLPDSATTRPKALTPGTRHRRARGQLPPGDPRS